MANGLFAGGNGTIGNPYLIEDADDLNAVRDDLTAHYKIIEDIDLNTSPYNVGEGWTPIGDYSTSISQSFTGVFEGDGFVIKNLYINRPNKEYQGLFGRTVGAEINNVKLDDVSINGSSNSGGLVGYSFGSSISNSYSNGSVNVTGNYAGGLVGRNNNNSSISNSYSRGIVTSSTYAGGLVGYNFGSSIINSHSHANVTSGSYIGGLVGRNNDNASINYSYSIGYVNGNVNSGGLVGANSSNSSILNSYWDIETSGKNTSFGGTGKSTSEMKQISTFANWQSQKLPDGTLIWELEEGEYPKLWFDKPPSKSRIMFKNDIGYYYHNSINWISLGLMPSVEQIIENGMEGVTTEQIAEFESLYGTSWYPVRWTDGNVSTSAKLNATPNPQILTAKNSIQLTGVENATFSWSATGDSRVALSIDEGVTYHAFKNGLWVDVTNDMANAMTAGEYTNMSWEQYKLLAGNSNFLKHQYYIPDNSTVDDILITAELMGTNRICPSTSYDLSYDQSSKTIRYNIKNSGSYFCTYVDIDNNI